MGTLLFKDVNMVPYHLVNSSALPDWKGTHDPRVKVQILYQFNNYLLYHISIMSIHIIIITWVGIILSNI